MSKHEELIKLAGKGGNDAHLLLLDKLHSLEEELTMHKESMKELHHKMDGIEVKSDDLKKTNDILLQIVEELKKDKDILVKVNLT